jgi:cobalt-zinc-cadmium efflux system membrane fusion protein
VNENQTWRVGAVTEGRIVKVEANPGDMIKAGQVLARMHSHEVHEGRAEYRKALNELSRARAAEGFAKQVRDRAKRLYDLKAAALEQVERTQAEVRNSQAAVELAEAELERTKTHLVDFLQVSLDEPDKHSDGPHSEGSHGDEDLIPVKAPAAGTLLDRKVTAGSVVAVAAEMFVISDLSTVWMQANVGESSITHVRPGQAVRIEVQSQPGRSFSGRVIKLGDQLDPATRTLPVRIELANPGGLLKPEMYADAELAAGGTRRALFVAESALQEVKGQTVVFVEKSAGQYDARAVETGHSLDGRVSLLNGVAAGDRVVVKGAFILKSQLLKNSLSKEE